MILKPTAELPAINSEKERSGSRAMKEENPPDNPTPQNNPAPSLQSISQQDGLEDKFLENLDEIEKGLRPFVEDGKVAKGIVTDFGKISLLAYDKNDNYVALKVKMGLANENDLLTTLASVGWLRKHMKIWSLVRVIMIAEAFDEKTVSSASALPNMELIGYEVKPAFKRLRG